MDKEKKLLLISGVGVVVVVILLVVLLVFRRYKSGSGGVNIERVNPSCVDCGEQTITITGINDENTEDDTVLVEGFDPSLLRSHRLAQLSNLL
jgi:hypothetical protein